MDEPISNEIAMEKIPINALRQKTRLILSKLLNSTKILSSDDGLPRDWRGIAYLAGLQSLHGPTISMQLDPMSKVLQLWKDIDQNQTGSFENLIKFLGVIDRWDIIDDIRESLVEDAKSYLTTKQQTYQTINNAPVESVTKITDSDLNILTQDDVLRSNQGLPPQQYDGFVIFADEDIDFATELIERMENFGLKLCIKDRDLIGGITFEHEAIMRLIAERCNRLIVIVSPAFLQSSANTFFVNFAQALGIEQRRRKIIPCLYQNCILPSTLSIYFLLNYQRSGRLWNFWDRLRDSIQNTSSELTTIRTRAITAPAAISNGITDDETIEPNDKYSITTTLPIKIPRKKHSYQNGQTKYLTISESFPVNLSTKCENFQTNSINNSNSMIDFNSANSINMKNKYVQLKSDIDKTSTTKKWYKKLLLNKKLLTTTTTTSNENGETNITVKEVQPKKKQWFKKKLISS